ncbi:MAG: archaemetzincin family Zn-dependent metalloprotease [Desulfomonile sp.]|nr:archaemetzincin family Zn-dependent metalloprotease [Desulfomonile sp.]
MKKKEPPRTVHRPPSGYISVVPLGHIKEDVLRVVADSIQGVLRLPVDVTPEVGLPESAFMSARNQYNVLDLIKFLESNHAGPSLKVLGVTAKDIANPILTYVFGTAFMDGKAAVVSTARLQLSVNGELVSREQFLERVVKAAIHEIGHTFNIPHCHKDHCVMRASNSLTELDEKMSYLCDYCELFLAEAVGDALRTRSAQTRQAESG